MFAPFDLIRIVNLPERRDRRQEMDRELAPLGLTGDPRLAYFPAVRPAEPGPFASIGARGCYESHLAILREAVAAGRSVLILEDDCAFAPEARDYAFGDGWDMFYGGYYTSSGADDLDSTNIFGSHMMGFTAEGARQVCAYLEGLEYQGVHPSIDAAYVWFRRARPEVPVRFAVPPLAGQRPSRSDIAELRFYDRLPVLRSLATLARCAVRRRRG